MKIFLLNLYIDYFILFLLFFEIDNKKINIQNNHILMFTSNQKYVNKYKIIELRKTQNKYRKINIQTIVNIPIIITLNKLKYQSIYY